MSRDGGARGRRYRGGDRATGGRREKSDVFLSKGLSRILRHKALEMGFRVQPGGFIYIDEILQKSWLSKDGYTIEDVQRVVEVNDKQRFMMQENKDTGRLVIRANQGHSFQVPDLDLTPITDPSLFPEVIHGTYSKCWNLIKSQGLKRMNRTHIHFAPGEPGEDGVISGMRQNCQIIIFLDIQKAISDGIPFSLSANNVILSPGEGDMGCIPPKYFSKVIQKKPHRHALEFDKGE
ncbi:tRNA 2'-phosphotransferase 1-like [Lineus longissimus]|uniref:tRNA 2'-phosphotransferase 1-like n=1 Tax=Lineus longissimus TaxID=88925 RepID=UPI002B4D3092